MRLPAKYIVPICEEQFTSGMSRWFVLGMEEATSDITSHMSDEDAEIEYDAGRELVRAVLGLDSTPHHHPDCDYRVSRMCGDAYDCNLKCEE